MEKWESEAVAATLHSSFSSHRLAWYRGTALAKRSRAVKSQVRIRLQPLRTAVLCCAPFLHGDPKAWTRDAADQRRFFKSGEERTWVQKGPQVSMRIRWRLGGQGRQRNIAIAPPIRYSRAKAQRLKPESL